MLTLDRYIAYPELMETLVVYLRREARRLKRLPDQVILGPREVGKESEGVKKLMRGKVRPSRELFAVSNLVSLDLR